MTGWWFLEKPLWKKWGFSKMGDPQNGWFIRENPLTYLKNMKVNWDDDRNPSHMGKCQIHGNQLPPTRWIDHSTAVTGHHWKPSKFDGASTLRWLTFFDLLHPLGLYFWHISSHFWVMIFHMYIRILIHMHIHIHKYIHRHKHIYIYM